MEQKFVTVPFDIEKAKAIQNGELEGKIVTRDGRSVRIVCFDRKSYEYPIVALIEKDSIENYGIFCIDGRLNINGNDANGDLFLQLPEYLTFKDGDIITDDDGCVLLFSGDVNQFDLCGCYCSLFADTKSLDLNFDYKGVFPETRLATESEKQKLIEALQESSDPRAIECLKKLGVEVKPKCEFTAGQPVIGVDGRGEWRYDLFSHYKPNKQNGEYVCTGRSYKHCLPYEGNENLLGTNKSAEE